LFTCLFELRKSSSPAGLSPCRHSSAPFGVGYLLKRKEKEEMEKKKEKNICNQILFLRKFSGVTPPYAKSEKSS